MVLVLSFMGHSRKDLNCGNGRDRYGASRLSAEGVEQKQDMLAASAHAPLLGEGRKGVSVSQMVSICFS